jgi:hypothetical protein
MDSLLRYAYYERRCNACGGTYRVTLLDALMEGEVGEDWRSPRHCEQCSIAATPMVSGAVPHELLKNLGAAWELVANASREAHLDLRVGG